MNGEHVFVLLIIAMVIGIPVVCSTVLKIVKQFHERENNMSAKLDDEEAQILHDLHKGLDRMEKRIASLETIIMEKKR